MYGGRQATVIYIINETKKIHAKFKDIKHSQKLLQAQQQQNFTSTVSHEMRTPLGSVQFFIKRLQTLIMKERAQYVFSDGTTSENTKNIDKYFNMILAQIILVQTFVDDLLDIK